MAINEEKGAVVAVLSQPDNISLFKEGPKVAPESPFSMEKMFSFYPPKSLIYQLPLLVVKKFDMPESNVTDRTLVQSPSKSSSFSKRCLSVVSWMDM